MKERHLMTALFLWNVVNCHVCFTKDYFIFYFKQFSNQFQQSEK